MCIVRVHAPDEQSTHEKRKKKQHNPINFNATYKTSTHTQIYVYSLSKELHTETHSIQMYFRSFLRCRISLSLPIISLFAYFVFRDHSWNLEVSSWKVKNISKIKHKTHMHSLTRTHGRKNLCNIRKWKWTKYNVCMKNTLTNALNKLRNWKQLQNKSKVEDIIPHSIMCVYVCVCFSRTAVQLIHFTQLCVTSSENNC